MHAVTLRQWTESDIAPYAEMNADLEVMRYFPKPLSEKESLDSMRRQQQLIAERGWGLWAVEVDGAFAGFTGLSVPRFDAVFMPAIEAGWRIRREFWGKGIATSAAQEALRYGFDVLKLKEIVSFTAGVNLRSRRLMERLGFIRDERSDFDHPLIPVGHELRRHVLYRKRANRLLEPTSASVAPDV
ncbi:GNAT family N-acetyltransferase [Opitutaceae bacterium EW11]|nr:GNAT family N-acetyltransferase [Opitutaceae bacterium EW11]